MRYCLCLLMLAGCGGGGGSVRRVRPARGADLERTVAGATALVHEIYGNLRRGNLDGMQNLLVPQPLVIGPGGESFTSASQAAVAVVAAVPRKKHKLRSRGLEIEPSPGGRAAWAADAIDLDGVRYRLSAVLVEDGGVWAVAAVQLLRLGEPPIPKAALPPAPAAAGAAVADGDLVAKLREWTAAPDRLPAQLSKTQDPILWGASPRDVARGPKAIKRWWGKRSADLRFELRGEPRAAVLPDGTLGWVAAAISAGGLQYRYLLVYARERGDWRLWTAHAGLLW